MIWPSDGRLVGFGPISGDGASRFAIKGQTYELDQLLGRDGANEQYADGEFAVVYLHPRDYHRVHVPADGALRCTRHIPGHRFPVAPWSEKRVQGIYGKNERLVFELELTNRTRFALVMVAAFGVGNIETPFAPVVSRDSATKRDFEPPVDVARGDDLGAFRLGSTVVLLWSRGAVTFDRSLELGVIRYGTRMGVIQDAERVHGAENR
jgi:phosphatidylserine decarboxylase